MVPVRSEQETSDTRITSVVFAEGGMMLQLELVATLFVLVVEEAALPALVIATILPVNLFR